MRGDLPVSEERDIRELSGKLRFLFKKTSMSKYELVEWLKVPEFVDTMLDMVAKSQPIDNSTMLPIMEKIYLRLSFEPPLSGVNYYNLRRGINRIIKVLYPDEYEQRKVVKQKIG